MEVVVETPLQDLFQSIAQAQDDADLKQSTLAKMGQYFVAKRQGIFFFDQQLRVNCKLRTLIEKSLSIEYNPVLRYVLEQHAPIHDEQLTAPKTWRAICPRADHWHVMAGPIVAQGQLVGAIGFTREQSMQPFNHQNLTDLSAICFHLSAWAASKRRASGGNCDRLTPRELEIANLVAAGLTNAAISRELWITENSVKQALKRMFRKLEVSSRTELVTQIFGLGSAR